jgi:ABC-type branched-subunit amino acid transport system substrate-binding protein
VATFISDYHVLVDSGVPVLYTSTPLGLGGIKPQLEKDQIPFLLGGVTGDMVYPPGWVYCVWSTPGEEASAVLDYFMQNWKEQRPPKLQLFVMDGVYGREPVPEITKYAESKGFEVLPLEVSPYVVLDATTQLLRIQQHQADLVYLQTIITGAGPIMRDVERLGLQNKMQFAGDEFVQGNPLIKMAPVGAEGFLAPRATPWMDETQIPGIKTMIDTEMKYHGQINDDPVYTSGWVYGAIMCEAVRRAGEEVGYDNINGPAVKRALESMKDFDVDGMVKITFGPDDRRGTRSFAVYQVKGGKVVRVSDWGEVPILVPWAG